MLRETLWSNVATLYEKRGLGPSFAPSCAGRENIHLANAFS